MTIPDFYLKPPLGLTPRRIHAEQRKFEIEQAIIRYTLAFIPVPSEWIAELKDIIEQLT